MSKERRLISPEQAAFPLFAGVDVGGSSTKIGLVDSHGETVNFASVPSDGHKPPEGAVERIAATIEELAEAKGLQRKDIAAVGLGTPGTMDIPAGVILEPPNLPAWRHYPIRDRLSQLCGLPVSYANDAGAAAYGEFWVGRGREFHSMVLLTLGTGVGGGIIIGDMSLDGENSHGSECGHIIINGDDSARVCSCGQRGHLEAYASATALVKRAEELLAATQRASTLRARVAAGESLSGLVIAQEAEAGDELATELVAQTAKYLAVGIVSLMHVIDPAAVVLGGAMDFGGRESSLGMKFLELVRRTVRARTFPVLAERTVIDFASLGGDAGYIGAAGIARSAYLKRSS